MVFQENFVAVVRFNGQILREQGKAVYLPFGSEYSLLLKNLHTTKALFSVDIDGQDVLSGQRIILDSKDEVNLEGFLNTSGKVTNRFKFIEKTKEISDFRGDRPDDGLIRIEYQFEAISPPINILKPLFNEYPKRDIVIRDNASWKNEGYRSILPLKGEIRCSSVEGPENHLKSLDSSYVQNDVGITVKGSESNQMFSYGSHGMLDPTKYVIIIALKGITETVKKVEKPILVKERLTCSTCGRRNDSRNRFCFNCGTALF